jgi:hypothetical protein
MAMALRKKSGKRIRNYQTDSSIFQGTRSLFPGRSATEILSAYQDIPFLTLDKCS